MGKYKDVVFEEDRTVEISGLKFIQGKCRYTQAEGMTGTQLTAFMYQTVKDNNFFKVRATVRGETGAEEVEKEIVSFIGEAMKLKWGNGVDLPESPENDRKILQMAKELYDNPLGNRTTDNIAAVIRYADKSKKITVTVKEGMLDIKDKYGRLFLGFYVAGSVKYYLEHPEDIADKDKSDIEIKRYLVKLYKVIQEKDTAYKNQIYDGMIK
jgi:hypothetical protein